MLQYKFPIKVKSYSEPKYTHHSSTLSFSEEGT